MSQSHTLDSVFQLPDNQIISFITSNGSQHSNSLTDRLIATILIHNAGKINQSDKHYIINTNFNTYYLMSDQDLTNLYNKIPASNRKHATITGHTSRLGMIRDIIDDSLIATTTTTVVNTPRKLSSITLIVEDGMPHDYLILDSDLERMRFSDDGEDPITLREMLNRWASSDLNSVSNYDGNDSGDFLSNLLAKLELRPGYSGRGKSAKVEFQSYGIIDSIYTLMNWG